MKSESPMLKEEQKRTEKIILSFQTNTWLSQPRAPPTPFSNPKTKKRSLLSLFLSFREKKRDSEKPSQLIQRRRRETHKQYVGEKKKKRCTLTIEYQAAGTPRRRRRRHRCARRGTGSRRSRVGSGRPNHNRVGPWHRGSRGCSSLYFSEGKAYSSSLL